MIDLEAIEECLDNATPGTWWQVRYGDILMIRANPMTHDDGPMGPVICTLHDADGHASENAALIVCAQLYLSELVAEVKRLRQLAESNGGEW